MDLVVDSVTVVLASIFACILFLRLTIFRIPPPAAHPLLLGRQSDAARVRRQSESPVWGSAPNAGRALQRRTSPTITNLATLALLSSTPYAKSAGCLAGGIYEHLSKPSQHLLVAISISDNHDLLLTLLSLSLLPAQVVLIPATLSGPLPSLPPVAAIIADSNLRDKLSPLTTDSTVYIDTESTLQTLKTHPSPQESLSKAGLDDVFMRYVQKVNNEIQVVDVTHGNLSAATVSLVSLFPSAARLTPNDCLLLLLDLNESLCSISIALTALYIGCDLQLASPAEDIIAKEYNPTVIFLPPSKLLSINTYITSTLPHIQFSSWAVTFKERLLTNGVISQDTIADNHALSQLRQPFPRLRAIFVIGAEQLAQESLTLPRTTLGIPVVSTLVHPTLSTGPITSTHFYDFQIFPDERDHSHHGAPVINGLVKVVGVDDAAVDKGQDPRGILHFYGPSVTLSVANSSTPPALSAPSDKAGESIMAPLDLSDDPTGFSKDWKYTTWSARFKANGTVKVLFDGNYKK